MGEIIYKKQFHREPIDETEPEVANFTDSGNAPSFDEIMKEIYSNVTYLVLPGREKKARNFIQKASRSTISKLPSRQGTATS